MQTSSHTVATVSDCARKKGECSEHVSCVNFVEKLFINQLAIDYRIGENQLYKSQMSQSSGT